MKNLFTQARKREKERKMEWERSFVGELFRETVWYLDMRLPSPRPRPALRPKEVPREKKAPPLEKNPLVLFVGDFPHKEESEREALLQKIIKAMNLGEGECATTCLFKGPVPEEGRMETLAPTRLKDLEEEIVHLRPRFIVCLGALVTNCLLGKKERLSVIHGQFFPKNFDCSDGKSFSATVVPVFHPDYLLINPQMKKTTWADLQKIMKHLEKI